MPDIYRQEDAQQILQIAIARQAEVGELSREQLYEIAAELNIAPLDIQAAEQEWVVRQGESQEKQAFDRFRQQKFQQRLVKFGIVNAFFVLLDLATGGGLGWSLYILLVWGLGVSLNGWKVYQTDGDDYEEAFQQWRQRRQLKRSMTNFINRWLGV